MQLFMFKDKVHFTNTVQFYFAKFGKITILLFESMVKVNCIDFEIQKSN